MVSGLSLGFKFVTCVPGNRKWPVDPASAIATPLAILICDMLNIVSFLFAEFIVISAVDALCCVPPLDQLLMKKLYFRHHHLTKKVSNNYY